MRFSQWPALASIALLAAGLSWLVKIGIIVATDGRIITTGPAAVLMSSGLILLLFGAAGVGAGLARHTHWIVRAGAALGAAGVAFGCCIALGISSSVLFRGYSPAYLAQEAGLFVAGLLWFTLGAIALRSTRRMGLVGRAAA